MRTKYILRGLFYSFFSFAFLCYLGSQIPFPTLILKFVYYLSSGILFGWLLGHTFWECDERTPEEYEELLKKKFFTVKLVPLFIVLSILVLGTKVYNGSVKVYNQNKEYTSEYLKLTQTEESLYDNMWKTYSQKKEIANVAKSSFMEVVKLIFENRKDGQNVSWKWLQENQPVPYAEFLDFYRDLTALVDDKRTEIYNIEVKKQEIVKSQNLLISKFPNNFYNKVLGIKYLNYKQSISSDSTQKVFKTGKENL